MSFLDNITDFYHWMAQFDEVNARSRTNYISWLKFLSNNYDIDEHITENAIKGIIDSESRLLNSRSIYKSEKDLVNFKSALRKYKKFVDSNYVRVIEETILSETQKIREDNSIAETEKEAIIRARIGQGQFRNRLLSYWAGCSITGCKLTNILIASHIKPWRNSNNPERLDVFNGLLLTPNYDKLFDLGFISFGNNGEIIFSKEFPKSERQLLGIDNRTHLIFVDERHFQYLKFHRENRLIQ